VKPILQSGQIREITPENRGLVAPKSVAMDKTCSIRRNTNREIPILWAKPHYFGINAEEKSFGYVT
jgi:hypothetical protein